MPGVLYARVNNAWVPITASGGGGASEVEIGTSDPIGTNSAAELWYDTDDDYTIGLTPVAVAGNALGIVAVGSFTPINPTIPANTTTQITANLSVPLSTGRRYRVSIGLRALSTPAALGVNIAMRDGTTVIPDTNGPWHAIPASGAGLAAVTWEWLLNGDGTTKTLNVVISAAGQITVYNDGQSYFYVEDLGPNTTPALPISETPPAWTAITTFANGWTTYESPGYRRIGDVVTLRGAISKPSNPYNTSAFTLPVGFRPPIYSRYAQGCFQTGVGGSYVTRVSVNTDGSVNVSETSSGWNEAWSPVLSLAGITFSVTP